jgi:RimJ/RimL family protein N-acetyltransferase
LFPQNVKRGKGGASLHTISASVTVTDRTTRFGDPIGFDVAAWTPCARPPRTPMIGLYGRVEPIDIGRHAEELHAANRADEGHRNWTYLLSDGFDDIEGYRAWLASMTAGDDPLLHAIVDATTAKAVGVAAFMRIEPAVGVIEVGNLNFSPLLQRTRLATEAMFLMMRRVFDELGYRRYEWKCDSLNAPSRRAAERLGFSFEGIFRQVVVYKGRNRDTAWFSVLDREWPALRGAYEQWLSPENFDENGRQRRRLADLIERARADHSGA